MRRVVLGLILGTVSLVLIARALSPLFEGGLWSPTAAGRKGGVTTAPPFLFPQLAITSLIWAFIYYCRNQTGPLPRPPDLPPQPRPRPQGRPPSDSPLWDRELDGF